MLHTSYKDSKSVEGTKAFEKSEDTVPKRVDGSTVPKSVDGPGLGEEVGAVEIDWVWGNSGADRSNNTSNKGNNI